MKKNIFEQTGNTITSLLIAFATIQSILLSPQPTKNSSYIIFGSDWLMLALWGALFYLLKHLYQKCLKDGYQIKNGELSSSDEREKEIGHLALKRTYQALLFFLDFYNHSHILFQSINKYKHHNSKHFYYCNVNKYAYSCVFDILNRLDYL